MLPLMILFADITLVVTAVGAIIFSILLFSNWDKKQEGEHEDSHAGH